MQEDFKNNEKIAEWFKKNVINFILFFVCIAFIFYDLLELRKSEKNWYEILADTSFYLIVSWIITYLVGKKGTLAGLYSKIFLGTKNCYAQSVEQITPNMDRLDNYCDEINEHTLKMTQARILRKARIKYETFIADDFDIDSYDLKKQKIIKRAINCKIRTINADYLLSEDTDRLEKGKKDVSLRGFEFEQGASNLVTKILIAIIFGVFSLYPREDFNYAYIIVSSIKIATWLLFSIMQYLNNYTFVTTTLRSNIVRKINHLDRFNTSIKKDKMAYATEREIIKLKEEREQNGSQD